MPSSNQNRTKELVEEYLDLHRQQDIIQEKLDNLKQVIAKFSKDTNQKQLRVGDTILKVRQYIKSTFPKIDDKNRQKVEEIMRKSKEWKQAITFDIVKLGLAFDKKKLSEGLRDKLTPYTGKEKVVRITKSKVRKRPKHA
jgi:hypothetical protein